MKKRIISLILCVVMLIGSLPMSALAAAYTEEQMMLYEQMLSLGLVDDEGDLIENTLFYDENGSVMASNLTEMRAILDDPETDLSQMVTVVGSGLQATLEDLITVLAIEDMMAQLSSGLQEVANGSRTLMTAANNSADTGFNHNARVSVSVGDDIKEYDFEDYSTRIVTFNLVDVTTGQTLSEPLPYDVSFTYEHAIGTTNVSPVNDTITIPAGSTSVSVEIKYDGLCVRTPGSLPGTVTEYPPYLSEYYHSIIGNLITFIHLYNPVNIRFYQDAQSHTLLSMNKTIEWPSGMQNFMWYDSTVVFDEEDETEGRNLTDKLFYIRYPFGATNYDDFEYHGMDVKVKARLYFEDNATKFKKINENTSTVCRPDISNNSEYALIPKAVIGFAPNHDPEYDELIGSATPILESGTVGETHTDWIKLRNNLNNYLWSSYYAKTDVMELYSDATFDYVGLPPYVAMELTGKVKDNDGNVAEDRCDYNSESGEIEWVMLAAPAVAIQSFYCYDDVAPTVSSIDTVSSGTYYPGDQVPIVVEFSEPVHGDYKLHLSDGTVLYSLESTDSDGVLRAKRRTFVYTVKEFDNTTIYVNKVEPATNDCTDAFGYYNIKQGNNDYVKYFTTYEFTSGTSVAVNQLKTPIPEKGITGLSMNADSYIKNTPFGNFQVTLNQDSRYQQVWINLGAANNPTIYAMLDGDSENLIPLALPTDGDTYYLYSEIDLKGLDVGQHYIDLMIQYPNKEPEIMVGFRDYFEITPIIPIPESDIVFNLIGEDGGTLDITQHSSWPSSQINTVYPMEPKATQLSYTYTPSITPSYTDFYWESSDTAVAEILDNGIIQPKAVGNITISLKNENSTPDDKTDDDVIKTIDITLPVDTRPGLMIVPGGNVFEVSYLQDCNISWANTLPGHEPLDGKIALDIYEGNLTDFTGATPISTEELERSTTSYTIPGDIVAKISKGDEPSYTVRLSAQAVENGVQREVSTVGYIVVRALPASVRLGGDVADNTYFTADKGSLNIDWNIDNLDTTEGNVNEFRFTVTKNGEPVGEPITEVSPSGSYNLTVSEPAEGTLRDVYIIEARAKNGSDPTWSYDSRTLYIYASNSLDILVEGESVDSVLLKNEVENADTYTVAPVITNTQGETITDLSNAAQIAALRGKLGLVEKISINYSSYAWSGLADTIKWDIVEPEDSEETVLTLNYRLGSLYEDVNYFTYESYTPDTELMLSGQKNGERTVTAEHSRVEGLSDSVDVSVERLYEQLYLFQFAPGIKTTLRYTDGKGNVKTVETNDDGSLALYEPNGIKSGTTMHTQSVNGTDYYLGTFDSNTLVSGETDGTTLQLYPLNTYELKLAAHAELPIVTPDGKPYAEQEIVVRGGVFRNGRYCEDALMSSEPGTVADLSGEEDQIFTTDEKGVLHVWFDIMQFGYEGANEDVAVGEQIQYVFELQFGENRTEYYPRIVYLNGDMSPEYIVRHAASLLTLEKVEEGMENQPFVSVQTVDYGTGRQHDVKGSDGFVGPSSNYPNVTLNTAAMLWNVDLTELGNETREFTMEMVDQYGEASKEQINEVVVYPFSSFALLVNQLTLDHGKLWWDELTTENRKLRMRIYEFVDDTSGIVVEKSKKLLNDIVNEFTVVDMKTVTEFVPIQEDANVLSIMSNISAWGTLYGADSSSNIVNKFSDAFLNDAVDIATKVGTELGTVKAVMEETNDPTVYEGYFWTGMDITQFEDLEYDNNFHFSFSTPLSYSENSGEDGEVVHEFFSPSFFTDSVELQDFMTITDMIDMGKAIHKDASTGNREDAFERSEVYRVAGGMAMLPFTFKAEGWLATEIRFNFENMQWEVLLTDGGFGVGGSFEVEIGKQFLKILNFSVRFRGGVMVDMAAALRYAEQLGLEWSDKNAKYVNDFLTALRVSVFLECFLGVGYHSKKARAKIGFVGDLTVDVEALFLNREYLKDPNERKLNGQYVQVDANLGVRAEIGASIFMLKFTIASVNLRDGFFFNDHRAIDDYWANAYSGLHNELARTNSLANSPSVKRSLQIEGRSYLDEYDRSWKGGATESTGLLRRMIVGGDQDIIAELQTNSYPFSDPLLSDDGQMLVYVSDAGSDQISAAEVSFSTAQANGQFPDGTAIPSPEGFEGWGDDFLDFDGTSEFAVAAWTSQNNKLHNALAGSDISESQAIQMLNSQEIVVSIWDGTKWTSTRLTDNGVADTMPMVAAANGKAIVAWNTGLKIAESLGFDTEVPIEDRILYKVYENGVWSDTYTLYNGSEGTVYELDAEMLSDGTAALAYSIDTGLEDDLNTNSVESGYEVFTAIVDTNAPEAPTQVTRLTTDKYGDDNPTLAATKVDGVENFILGWHSVQDSSGVEGQDIRFALFGKDGVPRTDFPDSIADVVTMSSFTGDFEFTKGTNDINELSIVWNTSDGEDNNGILKGVKFGIYNGEYGISAPIELAEMPKNTTADHFDVFAVPGTNGTKIKAVILGSTEKVIDENDPTTFEEVLMDDGTTVIVPKKESTLYTAIENYTNSIHVESVAIDYANVELNTPTSIAFVISNKGMDEIDTISITLGDGQAQRFDNLNLLPGRNVTLTAVHTVGDTVENVDYSISTNTMMEVVTGTAYLDYPDVGISQIDLIEEQDGLRQMNVTLYNVAAATLNKNGTRNVKLGVYMDSACNEPVDGKYFTDGTEGESYEITISDKDTLDAIDNGSYTIPMTFKIGDFVREVLELTEIPSGGVALFFKAEIKEIANDGTTWVTMPEVDKNNNQEAKIFNGFLARNGGAPTTVTLNQSTDSDGNTVANVIVQNNSLSQNSEGNIIATLLDENGNVLEVQQSVTNGNGLVQLGEEGKARQTFNFTKSGASVLTSYGNTVSDYDNAELDTVSLGVAVLPVTEETIELPLNTGSHTIILSPKNPNAKISVDGAEIENGIFRVTMGSLDKTFEVVVTAEDGVTQKTYTLNLICDYELGDLTLDGYVTNADVVTLAKYLIKLITLDSEKLHAADFDLDGEIDNSDLVKLARAVLEAI